MIRIITDSTCDISKEEQKELDIIVVPLNVVFGQESFKDDVDITHKQFYDRLKTAEKLPFTSQATPGDFSAIYEQYPDDDIVGIFLSTELSGTCQSAKIAAERDNVYVIDSRNVTMGLSLLVKIAVKYRKMGLSAKQIAEKINEIIPRVKLIASVETLKYLKMGGRLSGAAAVVGGMLGIIPIIGGLDGKIESIGKVRGKKAAYDFFEQYFIDHKIDENFPVIFGHSDAEENIELCKARFSNIKMDGICDIGCVVGTYAGPGAYGYAFVEVEK